MFINVKKTTHKAYWMSKQAEVKTRNLSKRAQAIQPQSNKQAFSERGRQIKLKNTGRYGRKKAHEVTR